MLRVPEKKYFDMDEINTHFQCSLELSAHLDMFWKHLKENKKFFFLFISMNIFLQSLYNLENKDLSPNRRSLLRGIQNRSST